jgi:hypothetical protein
MAYDNGIADVVITTKTLTLANTNYTFTFPANTKKIKIHNRSAAQDFKVATSEDLMTAGTYIIQVATTYFEIENLALDKKLTLAFQTTNAGDVLEIMYCK